MRENYIFLADGFEETEALGTLDVLRRGGVDVKTVSLREDRTVTGAHDVPVVADWTYGEFKSRIRPAETDVLVFPGGMPGTKHLAENAELMALMKRHYAEGGAVAAICAAPGLVVSQLPDLRGRKFTCYDGFEEALLAKGAEYIKVPAVADGNLITGRGPGCAMDFGLVIVEYLKGSDVAARVKQGLML